VAAIIPIMSERDDDPADVDREAILSRRKRFIAAALVGMASATSAPACSEPSACLRYLADGGPDAGGPDGGRDGGSSDAGGTDAGGADAGGTDSGSLDGSTAMDASLDAEPTPCLRFAPDGGDQG
jgi:hypothetical protein